MKKKSIFTSVSVYGETSYLESDLIQIFNESNTKIVQWFQCNVYYSKEEMSQNQSRLLGHIDSNLSVG